jgi:hypothetical protein
MKKKLELKNPVRLFLLVTENWPKLRCPLVALVTLKYIFTQWTWPTDKIFGLTCFQKFLDIRERTRTGKL